MDSTTTTNHQSHGPLAEFVADFVSPEQAYQEICYGLTLATVGLQNPDLVSQEQRKSLAQDLMNLHAYIQDWLLSNQKTATSGK